MIRLKKIALAALPLLVLLGACSSAKRQNVNKDGKSLSEAMAKTIMERFPFPIENNSRNLKWTYETGVYLTGISQVWKRTGNGEYFAYVQRCMDDFIEEDGSIKTYKFADYNLDNVRNGYTNLKKTAARATAYKRRQLLA